MAILDLGAEDAIFTPNEDRNAWAVACLANYWLVHCLTRRDAHAVGRVTDLYCEGCGGFDYEDEA